jgi:hypothetical protein
MYPFFNQEFARHHQEILAHEATYDRMLRSAHQQTTEPSIVPSRNVSPDPDFSAIRCDLHSTLSEWYLEPGTENFDVVIDTFMRRLKMRLGYHEQRKPTGSLL